jgi:hypothetical protein
LVAFGLFGFLLYIRRPLFTSIDAFLWIEGTVLLPCSIQPDDPTLQKPWRERLGLSHPLLKFSGGSVDILRDVLH